jgi:hypothetical protein
MEVPVSQTVFARFDGRVILPEEDLTFPPNARLRLVIDFAPEPAPGDYIFLRTAREQKLEGPSDWSERIDHYLYGEPGDGT